MLDFILSALPVLLPVAALLTIEASFVRSIRKRDGSIDFFELGIFYSAIVSLYAALPCLEYFVGGLDFSMLSESRLYRVGPTPKDLAPLFWYYTLYMACFWFAYSRSRGEQGAEFKRILRPDRRLFWLLLSAFLSVYVFMTYVNIHFRLPVAESYADTYLLYENLPFVWRQLASHAWGISLLLEMVLMAFLVAHYDRYKRLIFAWLVIEIASLGVLGVGSRTGLFILFLTLAITYHSFVKKLTWKAAAAFASGLLLLFLGLGIVRAVSSSTSRDAEFNLLTSSNEFDGILANAYDIRELRASGETRQILPWIYFSDITNLIPDQLFPVQKLDPSNWYVQTFYPEYADRGGGFAFGAIAESVAGLGWIDVIWRGALVGWAFGCVRRYFATGETTFWKYVFYLWVTVFCYQTFRGTTFVLLPRAVYLFALPAVVLRFWRSTKPQDTIGVPAVTPTSM
jgi:hypothetical protein